MIRNTLTLFALWALSGCTADTPCPSGQRLAENQQNGSTIRYCVSLEDGKATGQFSCSHVDGREVTGAYDHNRKIGEWRYLHRGGELLRIEHWERGKLVGTDVRIEEEREPLSCGKHVIVEKPPELPDLNLGWDVDPDRARRYFPDSEVVWMEGPYRDGLKDGVWRYRRRDGGIHIEGRYRSGVAHGPWIRYDRGGKPDARARYQNGRLIRGRDLATEAASVKGLVSGDPTELTRDEVRRALEEALH